MATDGRNHTQDYRTGHEIFARRSGQAYHFHNLERGVEEHGRFRPVGSSVSSRHIASIHQTAGVTATAAHSLSGCNETRCDVLRMGGVHLHRRSCIERSLRRALHELLHQGIGRWEWGVCVHIKWEVSAPASRVSVDSALGLYLLIPFLHISSACETGSSYVRAWSALLSYVTTVTSGFPPSLSWYCLFPA